jgi:CxxC motif-containing protein (DUF1111 family)
LTFVIVIGLCTLSATAVSPAAIEQGRQLFERNWQAGNPAFGSDGLGPLFNGQSCVVCHHQGGVGGGGESEFNAQSLGIERLEFSGLAPSPHRLPLLRSFYPGFVMSGVIMNSAALPHHGGSSEYAAIRRRILAHANVIRSAEGGPANATEVRISTDFPILFHNEIGGETVTVRARLFQRNTTSLFGAGLIDTIPESEIKKQIQLQSLHPEISGRPSILRDGSFGRFGWRANASQLVLFVERACANELSLETKRRPQAIDPSRPLYRNPSIDISDAQIESMSAFIATLPRPTELKPTDSSSLAQVRRGRESFEAVGCAVCHAPKLGNVAGVYSDLLLHDMGPYLFDFDAAEPYVISQRLSQKPREIAGTAGVSYYGLSRSVGTSIDIPNVFESPRSSNATSDFVTVAKGKGLGRFTTGRVGRGSKRTAEFREELGFERRLRPSNTSQEWRTPPLWGVADSAPYMHDGRAETLLEAISMHDGESAGTRDRFLQLPLADRFAVIAFLETLVAPPNVPQPGI